VAALPGGAMPITLDDDWQRSRHPDLRLRPLHARRDPGSARARAAGSDLERAGFARSNVERALDWLTELAFGQQRPAPADAARDGSAPCGVRVFADSELLRLSPECRGLLLTLERARVITPQQREIVIERMLRWKPTSPTPSS